MKKRFGFLFKIVLVFGLSLEVFGAQYDVEVDDLLSYSPLYKNNKEDVTVRIKNIGTLTGTYCVNLIIERDTVGSNNEIEINTYKNLEVQPDKTKDFTYSWYPNYVDEYRFKVNIFGTSNGKCTSYSYDDFTSSWYDTYVKPNSKPTKPGTPTKKSTTTSSITVQWDKSTDSDGDTLTYKVEYSKRYENDGWNSCGDKTTKNYKTCSGLDDDTQYEFQVTVDDTKDSVTSDDSAWIRTDKKQDTTKPTEPGKPSLNDSDDTGYSDSDEITNKKSNLSFSWDKSTDASGIKEYQYCLKTSSSCSESDWKSTSSTSTSKDFSVTSDGTYYLRIRAVDKSDNANKSDESSYRKFVVDTTKPSKPSLDSPDDNDKITDKTPKLDWDSADGAYRYYYKITDKDYSGTGDDSGYTTNTYKNVSSNMQLDDWYWYVCSEDKAGNQNCSDEWEFEIYEKTDTEFEDTKTTPNKVFKDEKVVLYSELNYKTTTYDYDLKNKSVKLYIKKPGSSSYESAINKTSSSSNGSVSHNYYPNKKGTYDYYFKYDGDSTYNGTTSSILSFEVENKTPNPPTKITKDTVTKDSIKISWSGANDEDGSISSYKVRYGKKNTIGWSTWASTTESEYTATSLESGTSYVFEVKAEDNDGAESGEYNSDNDYSSGISTKYAMSMDISSSPTNLEIDKDSKITFTPNLDGGGANSLKDLTLSVTFNNQTKNCTTTGYTGTCEIEFNLPDSDGEYTVIASFAGNSKFSEAIKTSKITVKPSTNQAPSKPGKPILKERTKSSITVQWDPSIDPEGTLVTYKVEYGKTFDLLDGWKSCGDITTKTFKECSGLEEDTSYQFKVTADDTKLEHESDTSDGIKTDKNHIPTIPTNFKIDATSTEDSISLSWTAFEDVENDEITYKINLYDTENKINKEKIVTGIQNLIFNGLNSYHDYKIKISAKDTSSEYSSWSDEQLIKTKRAEIIDKTHVYIQPLPVKIDNDWNRDFWDKLNEFTLNEISSKIIEKIISKSLAFASTWISHILDEAVEVGGKLTTEVKLADDINGILESDDKIYANQEYTLMCQMALDSTFIPPKNIIIKNTDTDETTEYPLFTISEQTDRLYIWNNVSILKDTIKFEKSGNYEIVCGEKTIANKVTSYDIAVVAEVKIIAQKESNNSTFGGFFIPKSQI
jgi:hypothetical protein